MDTFQIIVAVGVIVAALALVLQLACLAGMFLAVNKLKTQVMQVWPEVMAIITTTKRITADVEVQVKRIGETSNTILATTRQQVAKIDELLNDATTRAKVQMERAEMVLDDSLSRAQQTVSIIQRTVLRPVREIHGVLSGIRTTFAYISRSGRPTVDHATADEEMFI